MCTLPTWWPSPMCCCHWPNCGQLTTCRCRSPTRCNLMSVASDYLRGNIPFIPFDGVNRCIFALSGVPDGSHNPLVVGSSPTRPTSSFMPNCSGILPRDRRIASAIVRSRPAQQPTNLNTAYGQALDLPSASVYGASMGSADLCDVRILCHVWGMRRRSGMRP